MKTIHVFTFVDEEGPGMAWGTPEEMEAFKEVAVITRSLEITGSDLEIGEVISHIDISRPLK